MFDFLGGFDFDPDDGMDAPDDLGDATLGTAIGDEVTDVAPGEMTADGGTVVDLDGDGIADGVQFTGMTDLDGDGMEETIIQQNWIDTDGDGILDTMANTIASDTDGDGSQDTTQITMFTDSDGDGELDTVTNAVDLDGDGSLDVTETNSFGAEDETDEIDVDVTEETDVDPTDDSEMDLEEDTDLDDFPGEDEFDIDPAYDVDPAYDSDAFPEEEDGDDTVIDDTTSDAADDDPFELGDDISDASDGETTEDGGVYSDLDGDGDVDAVSYVTEKDKDGDGQVDTIVVDSGIDTDGDGKIDSVEQDVYEDTDGDGIVDSSHMVQYVDTDNDGQFDVAYQEDSEGNAFGVTAAEAYEQHFDADDTDLDSVVGDPETAMDSWHLQEETDTCAVASQEFVLEQLTGEEYDEDDLADIAEENGWYTDGSGTTMDDVGNILEYMGLQVEKSSDNDISDIEECLENGGAVIVAVDSGELWSGENEESFGPGNDPDHAVQVIGIDYSDPDNPMVIINDPGVANGCGAMVPLDEFMDAWEDSGCYMVEAYA